MTNETWDRVGIVLSVGCMIHCILLPLILPLLPLLGFMFNHDGWIHLTLWCCITCTAVLALIPGALKHHRAMPLVFGLTGVALLLVGGLAELGSREIWWMTTCVTCCGSALLTMAHYLNHRYKCKLGTHCDCGG